LAEPLQQRLQLVLTVVAVAVAAAGAVVGITLETRDDPPKLHAQPGKPPVPKGLPGPAGPQIERAFAAWPRGSLTTLTSLQSTYPRNAVVQFYAGLGYLWAGYDSEGGQALSRAKTLGRDTPIEVSADSLLHQNYYTGDPPFTPSAQAGPLLQRGAALWQAGRRHSAERVFARAARLDPGNPEALGAADFARFDKDNPSAAFSRLGPLVRRYPGNQSLRYNLGLLLAWIGQGDAALAEFRKAEALGRSTTLGRDAHRFVAALTHAGSKPPNK
jgi:tetratricopeptide (TPR) repeat protein